MIWIGIGTIVFFIDFFVKRWAEKNLKGKGKQPVGKTGFSLQLIHNKGFAGSRMKDNPALVKTLHTIILVCLGLFCMLSGCFKKGRELTSLGLSLILGGGASNLYDRIKHGQVTDYLCLPVMKKLVFNISDLFIFAGTVLIFLEELIISLQSQR